MALDKFIHIHLKIGANKHNFSLNIYIDVLSELSRSKGRVMRPYLKRDGRTRSKVVGMRGKRLVINVLVHKKNTMLSFKKGLLMRIWFTKARIGPAVIIMAPKHERTFIQGNF